jgi:hypothetical protein
MKTIPLKIFCCLILFLFLLAGCGVIKSAHNIWFNETYLGRQFENVLVIGVAQKLTYRNFLEGELVNRIKRKGINAFPSSAALSYTNKLTRETVFDAVEKLSVDCFLIISLMPGDREGKTIYDLQKDTNPYTYYSGLTEPSTKLRIEQNSSRFFLKAALYDAASEKLAWSLTSQKTFNLSSKSLNAAARVIFQKLRKEDLI